MTLDLTTLKREARKKGTSAARLLELAALDVQLLRTVAKSKHAPAHVLEALSRSGDLPTRKAVAGNPVTPLPLLEKLARDHQWTVLKALAVNPAAPTHLLEQLAQHKRDTVRYALFERYFAPLPDSVQRAFLHSAYPADRRRLAGYWQLMPSIAQELSQDTDAGVLFNLTKYNGQAVPESVLEGCAHSDDPALREEVARLLNNPEILLQLLNDENERVRCVAAHNPAAPADALEQLAQHLLLEYQQGKGNEYLTHALLFNPTTPKHLRHELRQYVDRPLRNLVDAEDALKGATP